MVKTFKLKPKQLNYFYNLLGHEKEYGGNLKIIKNNVIIVYEKKGENFKVRMNFQGEYDLSYHTHAYLANLSFSVIEIFKTIKNEIFKLNLNKGLYLFEANIMKIHPPSPQDCKLCSIQKNMLVFTQEGIYFMKYKNNTMLSHKDILDIERQYYKNMWGTTEQNVRKHISSNNPNNIMKILYSCQSHRNKVTYYKSIHEYIKFIKTKNIYCKLIPWNYAQNHIFTI